MCVMGEVNVPHVCFAPSCAAGCTEEENTAGWEQLSCYPIVRMIVGGFMIPFGISFGFASG